MPLLINWNAKSTLSDILFLLVKRKYFPLIQLKVTVLSRENYMSHKIKNILPWQPPIPNHKGKRTKRENKWKTLTPAASHPELPSLASSVNSISHLHFPISDIFYKPITWIRSVLIREPYILNMRSPINIFCNISL